MKKHISSALFRNFLFLFICFIIAVQIACIPFMRAKKEFQNQQNNPFTNNPTRQEVPATEFNLENPSDVFRKEINALLLEKNYTEIEKIADNIRKNKERVLGGYWKIQIFYEAVTMFNADYKGQKISDEMWKNRIELLRQWKQNSPNKITPRVALSKGLIEYGWFIRGSGTINKVSRENYEDFQQKLNEASEELSEAYRLKEKCPGWYRETLYLAGIQNWSSEDIEKLFDEAIKFEPNYIPIYLVRTHFLSPKWGAESGDWRKFLDALPEKLATVNADDGNIIYFVVAANKLSDSSESPNLAMMSNERITKGFKDLENKYQVDNYRLNQYAYISTLTMNFPEAQEAFRRIGDNFDKSVWGEKTFKALKQMAESPPNANQR